MNETIITPAKFRSELHDVLLAHPGVEKSRRRPQRSRYPLARPLAPVLTLAAFAVAAALVFSAGGELSPPQASAARVLRASANALERTGGSLALGADDYFYAKTATWFRYRNPAVTVRAVSEQWVARNGAGRETTQVVSVTGRVTDGPGSPTRSGTQALDPSPRPFDLPGTGLSLSYRQLRALPGDPARLHRVVSRIAARSGYLGGLPRQGRDIIVFDVLRDLAELPTPPRVRAALYRVLSAAPGLRLVGRAVDALGRPGVAVGLTVDGIRLQLIISPSSGQLLQTSRTLVHRSAAMPGYPIGLVNRATFITTGVVRSPRSRPR
jgi:hypothetical protein